MIEIEKGVPLPKKRSSELIRALQKMDIGDSCLVSGSQTSALQACRTLAPKKYTTRKVEGGIRIWRME